MVLRRVEAALALAWKIEASVPGVRDARVSAIGQQEQGPGAPVGDHAKPVPHRGDVHAPSVAAGHRVVVAVVHEEPQLEPDRTARAEDLIANVRRIGARLHPDALLDERVGDRVCPHGRRPVQGEALDRGMAAWLDRAAGPAVSGERERAPVVRDDLVGLGDEERPPQRRIQGGDEQPVVAARQRAGDGARGVATDAVGAEPFPPLRGREIARDLPAPADHASRLFRWSPTRSALAMMVSAGFTAALDGKKLPSTT